MISSVRCGQTGNILSIDCDTVSNLLIQQHLRVHQTYSDEIISIFLRNTPQFAFSFLKIM